MLQVGQPVDVEQQGWRGQTEAHRWDEALAAGQNFGVVAMLSQQRDGFLDALWRKVIEGSWDHLRMSFALNDSTHQLELADFPGNQIDFPQ
jgi:hypothetical protein